MQRDVNRRMPSIIDLNVELAKLTIVPTDRNLSRCTLDDCSHPQGAWDRFHSSEGVRLISATPFPGEHIELDVDDPRTVEHKSA